MEVRSLANLNVEEAGVFMNMKRRRVARGQIVPFPLCALAEHEQ